MLISIVAGLFALIATSPIVSCSPHPSPLPYHPAFPECPTHNNSYFLASTGSHFKIECFVDRSGVELYHHKNPNALFKPSFVACIDACNFLRECVDLTYVPKTGACYLKATRGPPRANGLLVWGAMLWEEDVHEQNVDPPSSSALQSTFSSAVTPASNSITTNSPTLAKRILTDGTDLPIPLTVFLPLLKSEWDESRLEEAKDSFYGRFQEQIGQQVKRAQRNAEPYAHYVENLEKVGRALWPVDEADKLLSEKYIEKLIGLKPREGEEESEWEAKHRELKKRE